MARLALWPLSLSQRAAVRICVFLSAPAFLFAAGTSIAVRQGGAAGLLLASASALQTLRTAVARLRLANRLRLPRLLPTSLAPGTFAIALLQIRQTSTMLDTYLSAALSLGGFWYSRVSHPSPQTRPVLAMLVALALSTHTQTLFGYDGPEGVARFRLWPLPGWRIFAMKDAGVLAVATLLLLPLDLTTGLSSLLASLAIGHHGSMVRAPFQRRWRFSAGRLFMTGLLKIAAVFSTGTASQHFGLPVLGGAAAACAISAWWCGRVWDRSLRSF